MWTRYRSKIAFIILALLFMISTNAFYFFAYSYHEPGKEFTGVNVFAPGDKMVYYSLIEQGRQGKMMQKNLHTSEPQKGLFFSPHWWLIGQTARLFGLANDVSYHLYRIILNLIMVGLLWFVSSKLFHTLVDRICATALVMFASGGGWLIALFRPAVIGNHANALMNKPVDLYMSELAPFVNSTQSPLFILSHVMLVGVIALAVQWRQRWSWSRAIILSGLAGLTVVMHPYDLWIVAGVVASLMAYKLWRGVSWSALGLWWAIIVGLLLGALYVYLGLIQEVAISGWSKQNLVYSPPLYNYIIGLGFLFPLWLIGMYDTIKRKYDSVWWMWIVFWSSIVWLLVYLPVDYNRRMANGWLIPIGYLAYCGLKITAEKIPSVYLKGLYIYFLTAAIVFGSWYSQWLSVQQIPSMAENQLYYLSSDIRSSLEAIKLVTTERDVFLSSDSNLNLIIPAYTGRRVYIGHQHQTVNFPSKEQQSNEFWSGSTGMDRLAFLRVHQIDYVVVLYDEERGEEYYRWLDSQDYLQPMITYSQGGIYKVVVR